MIGMKRNVFFPAFSEARSDQKEAVVDDVNQGVGDHGILDAVFSIQPAENQPQTTVEQETAE